MRFFLAVLFVFISLFALGQKRDHFNFDDTTFRIGQVKTLEPLPFCLPPQIEKRLIVDSLGGFLLEHANLTIEISAHTDSRGSAGYNLEFSQRQADMHRQNLIEKFGIDPSRIIAKGYGKEKILNHCTDGIQCTENEHSINRRIEVIILNL